MYTTSDFKTGLTIGYKGNIYSVMEFMHVKSANSMAFVRTKVRNLRTGAITEMAFNAQEKFERAQIDKIAMQYLYGSDGMHVFMNLDNYEQIEIPNDQIKNEARFIVDGMTVEVLSYNEVEILGINLPDKVALTVKETVPGVKGDTKTTAMKDAVLETGLQTKVPMFIEEGERIVVSTIDGSYVSREK